MAIPILLPRLPTAGDLRPYLERIDRTRSYSNLGPLVLELQQRLGQRVDVPPAGVVSAANATLAITAALLAQSPRPGSLCMMPAWTFIASPQAAISAGLVPYFVDVDAKDWLLDPSAAAVIAARMKGEIGAVMPVAAFGTPIDVAAWDDFRRSTGLAVVIDSAAGFDAMKVGNTPNVVSLHATKALGAGEGGFIASRDEPLMRRIQSFLLFGFQGSREAVVAGFNGKMSEYHAAVGLAALDGWDEARQALITRAQAYSKAFRRTNAVRLQRGFGDNWIANTCVVELPDGAAYRIANRLASAEITTRHWWGRGAHAHLATQHFPKSELEVTERLAVSTIGLPFYVDLPLNDVDKVASEIIAEVSS